MNDVSAAPYAAIASTTMPTAGITTGKRRSGLEFESDNDDAATTLRIDDRLISVQYISVENYDDDEESSSRPTANDIFFNNNVVNNSATTATYYMNTTDMPHRNRDHLH